MSQPQTVKEQARVSLDLNGKAVHGNPGGYEMRTARFVQMREAAIRRPGEPAGVGPVNSPWVRTSAMGGRWSVGLARRADPVAAAATESSLRSLLTNGHANSTNTVTKGQS
jgi:hypothetical protein